MIPDIVILPNEIEKASDEHRLIIFLGAGISCAAGLPSWDKVKNDLIDLARLPLNYDKNIKDQLRNMETYACFERIRREDRTTYDRIIESFLSSTNADLDKFRQLLGSLKSLKPTSIITINVDDLLFDCGVFRSHQFRYMDECAPQELRDDKVFFLHRSLDRKQEGRIIFNTRDKMSLYASPFFTNFLNNVFGSYCVLFIGFSFRDTDLLKYATLNPKFGDRNNEFRGHVALLPSNHEGPPYLELEQQYGIDICLYDNADGSHKNFEKTILSWQK
ncbi:SIR2 family protein [Candidatus Poribacteria bacterium]|nr:SIR2 family protein [Candidatus Poribacteria bacterium]